MNVGKSLWPMSAVRTASYLIPYSLHLATLPTISHDQFEEIAAALACPPAAIVDRVAADFITGFITARDLH